MYPTVDGGLVVGNVYDANTFSALNGADVSNTGGYSAPTLSTPADPAVDDGFYTIFSPAGSQAHTASMAGYVPSTIDVTVVASDTVGQDFFLDTGWLSGVDPTGLDVNVAEGYTVTQILSLFNTGGGPTNFVITEGPRTLQVRPAAALPGSNPATARRIPLDKLSDTPPSAVPLADIIQDGSFEAGSPNPYWEEFSTNFGTPICDAGACGTGGGTAGPRTGAFWAWFGGIPAVYEQGYLRQTLVIPAGSASLSLWLWIGTTGGPVEDYFNVTVDGDEVFRATADEQPLYSTYTQVVVDISAYADGGSHIIELQSETFGTTTSNFNVDDVVLDSSSAFDIPWLAESPVTGTIDADSTADIDVTFDSLTYTLGTQVKAMLTVASDDAYGSTFEIPVTMTIGTLAYGVDVGADQALSGRPAETVTYHVTVMNAGNGPADSFDLSVSGNAWTTTAPATVGPLGAGDSATVDVTVEIPSGAAPGDSDVAVLTATSQGDPGVSDSASLTTTVIGEYAISLEPPEDGQSGAPGDVVTYTLTLSNLGDAPTTVDLTFAGNVWDVSLPETSFDLGIGETVEVVVNVTIPAGAGDGDMDGVTITATGLGGATDSSLLTTTAVIPTRSIYLPLVMKGFTP